MILWTASTAVFILFLFIKYCQYRGCQLPLDTTVTGNLAYTILHRASFESVALGVPNYMAVHLMPAIGLFSPLLLLWNDVFILAAAQTALLASVPAAVYLLTYRRSGSPLAAWSAFWLVFTSPFFFSLAGSNVALQVALPAVFLWGAYWFETGCLGAAAACGLLMLLTIEQTPVLFFGLGLYWLSSRRDERGRPRWAEGLAACALSLIVLGGELGLMAWLKSSCPHDGCRSGASFDQISATLTGVAWRALTEPLAVLRAVAWPLWKLKPLTSLLLSTGLVCLCAPLEMIPWAVNFAPHLLANPISFYHDLTSHYPAYVVGPLWWALAAGTAWAFARLSVKGQQAFVLIGALGVGALNLRVSPDILLADWSRTIADEVPALVAKIPPSASVWGQEYALPRLASRLYVKALPHDPGDSRFENGLFKPDYVLINRGWADTASPEIRDRLLAFLAHEGYAKIAEQLDGVLLKHPNAPLVGPEQRPAPLQLPEAGAGAAAFADYLRRNDDPSATTEMFRKAAEGGEPEAQIHLASRYERGEGAPRDEQAALKWWRAAANQGERHAQNRLGVYSRALGNASEAASWFSRAAAQADAEAEKNLGLCYLNGFGVTKDPVAAVDWLRRSADQGNPNAAYNLGVCYASGLGVAQDPRAAELWLGRAAQAGFPAAQKLLRGR